MPGQASDKVKPWSIRGVPQEERSAATEAAKRAGQTLGEWISRAARAQIQQEAGANRLPVPVPGPGRPEPPGTSDTPEPPDTSARLSDVERVALVLCGLSASGVPVPKGHARQVTRALVDQLPPRPRKEAA